MDAAPYRFDLNGQTFGYLKVVRYLYHSRWLVRCLLCNREKVDHSFALRHNLNKTCGKPECRRRAFGYAHPATHKSWSEMRQRCENPSNKKYTDYGGRGIGVCDRWQSYPNFLADMGERPDGDYSIGRIDNDGNYEPENCRWETRGQQMNNKRDNVILELNGKRMTLTQWSREINIPAKTLFARLYQGWTHERALTQPLKKVRPSSEWNRKAA